MHTHLQGKIYEKELLIKAEGLVKNSVWPQEVKELLLHALSIAESTSSLLREKEIATEKIKILAFPQQESKSTLFEEELTEVEFDAQGEHISDTPQALGEGNLLPFPRRRRRRPKITLHASVQNEKSCVCDHKSGDSCPHCKYSRLYPDKPRIQKLVMSARIVQLHIVEQEVLRCRSCEHTEIAPLPEAFHNSHEGIHIGAIATFADLRYRLGMPSLRIEDLTTSAGVLVSDTVQFRIFEWASAQVFPVFKELKNLAANAELIYRDDSPNRIIQLRKKIELQRTTKTKEPDLLGINTTIMRAVTSEKNEICIFSTSNSHAGKEFENLMTRRDSENPVISMSDALSANHAHAAHSKTTTALCLVHLRREFYELRSHYPKEAKFVVRLFAEVFANDQVALQKNLNPQQRLEYHQLKSAPLMEKLLQEAKKQQPLSEPHSYIAKAWNYLLRHWHGLTRFLHVPGSPLHNNLAEQSLKVPIRHRKNSLSFLTENGALVADVLTSVLYTAQLNNLSPPQYLELLLKNREALRTQPHTWLPWSTAAHHLRRTA